MLSWIDIVIIVGYFAVVLWIGFRVARTTETDEELFLAGRQLFWPAVGFSLFASNISSATLVGLAGDAYRYGVSVSSYEWFATISLVVLAVFLIPFYIGTRISTVPEYLEKRYGRLPRLYYSALSIFITAIVDTSVGLYAGGTVLRAFFPDLNLWIACPLLAVVAGLYTAAGGLKAVVYTDVIQAVILIVGTTILALIVFGQFGFSWSEATADLPAQHLHMLLPADNTFLPWTGLITGVPLLGFYYWGMNQYIVQRVLGARDMSQARWGALLAGLLKLTPLFIMVLPGIFAVKLLPDLQNPDQVFPTLIKNYLPVGLLGLVMAGLIAAIMSSVDSTLNSASTMVVMDFVKPRRPELTAKTMGSIGRITTIAIMVFAALWAPVIGSLGGLWQYLQSVLAYTVPPIIVIYLLGMFWNRGNLAGAMTALVGGHLISLTVGAFMIAGFIGLHFTVVVAILVAASGVLYIVGSLAAPSPAPERLAGVTWQARVRDEPPADGPFWKDYRYQAVFLLLLTIVVVALFI